MKKKYWFTIISRDGYRDESLKPKNSIRKVFGLQYPLHTLEQNKIYQLEQMQGLGYILFQ